jgi:hypothetical protein
MARRQRAARASSYSSSAAKRTGLTWRRSKSWRGSELAVSPGIPRARGATWAGPRVGPGNPPTARCTPFSRPVRGELGRGMGGLRGAARGHDEA